MESLGNIVSVFFLMILISIILMFPFMWIWDDVVTELFDLRRITLFQSWELLMLCNILFKWDSFKS